MGDFINFMYDPAFADRLGKPGKWHCPAEVSGSLEKLALFAEFQLSRAERLIGEEPARGLYYALMDFRKTDPAFFPAHDICLAAANAALRVAGGGPVALMDWELLPAAILLAGRGMRINLPEDAAIAGILNKYLPGGGWEKGKGGMALAARPEAHVEKDPDFLSGLAKGVFVCRAYFLDRPSFSHLRERMLETCRIGTVLQLPKPRRQKAAYFPAILAFDGEKRESARLAAIEKCGTGPGALDMDECMRLMWDQADGARSRDISVSDILKDGKCDLFPQAWLGAKKPEGALVLGSVASVMRARVWRRKAEDMPKPDRKALLCKEITLDEIDPLTGFVDADKADDVWAEIHPDSLNGAQLLRKNDIIIIYRGADGSLGRVGLVAKECAHAIPCQYMCLVRPLHGADPIWLFYALRRPEVAAYLKAQASGGRVRMAAIETVRSLPLDCPDASVLEKVDVLHGSIMEKVKIMERIREEIEGAMEGIGKTI